MRVIFSEMAAGQVFYSLDESFLNVTGIGNLIPLEIFGQQMHERIVWFAGQGDRDSTGQMKREMLSPRYTTRINKRSPRNKVSTPLSGSVSLS